MRHTLIAPARDEPGYAGGWDRPEAAKVRFNVLEEYLTIWLSNRIDSIGVQMKNFNVRLKP